MDKQSSTIHLKREVLVRLIRAYLTNCNNDFLQSVDKIPYDMRPKNADVPFRCCIHKERAILRQRAIASLGHSVEKDDEITPLSEYAQKAAEREKIDKDILTVVETACKGCVPSRVYVTDLCQGCVARPCISVCSFGAVSLKEGRSVISGDKCKNCGKCIGVCPYSAIVKLKVPCEDICPVSAITKNESGYAEIDFDKCISCGACVGSCPFAAVYEKSQIFDVLKQIKAGKKVIAFAAPSVVGQLPVSINKIAQGLIESGFSEVFEVAQGADITTKTEALEFQERMEAGEEFMTTSCCSAYNELVDKHVPELKDFRSTTRTPLHYSAKLIKERYPYSVVVFIGPCVSKRREVQTDEYADYALNFEEMGALFVAKRIELSKCQDYQFANEASREGRNYAVSNGVAQAVKAVCHDFTEIFPACVDGLTAASVKDLKAWAKNGVCPLGNLIEVMACPGGCVGGSDCINDKKITTQKVREYAESGKDINEMQIQ